LHLRCIAEELLIWTAGRTDRQINSGNRAELVQNCKMSSLYLYDKPRGAALRGWPASSPLCCFFCGEKERERAPGRWTLCKLCMKKLYLVLRKVSYSFLCFSLVCIVVCFFFLGAEGEKNNFTIPRFSEAISFA
jgi:hypothetical protein